MARPVFGYRGYNQETLRQWAGITPDGEGFLPEPAPGSPPSGCPHCDSAKVIRHLAREILHQRRLRELLDTGCV